ncbi:acyltransferase [Flavobacterium beibuense]|uniref:Bacterial transferase hexapeptide repeat protein n=1 Tax=Flavobacterium beibuense TaxID=657326 RepID=A0A444W6I1_9FLAO|nr:acyltransferase [Flavobacterium beibuense]RYJ41471.1 Bacterial transferase hexapeptide repeat protein [Flavobacterium beibuense]
MKRKLINWAKPKIKRLLGIRTYNMVEELTKKGFTIGERCNIQPGCIIDDSHSWHIEIGNDVTLAPRVHILAHDASTWTFLGYTKIKNTKIGNRVFIGASSIILPGVIIGNDVIIGAGSVVTKSIPDNSVYAGNPAKFIMATSEYIQQEKQKMNTENCFGREFSEANNVSMENKMLMKRMAEKYGTAYAQ